MPNRKRRVVILQEYIPKYREALYRAIDELADAADLQITVASGSPSNSQAARNDTGRLDNSIYIEQREFSLLGRRLVLRQTADAIAGADLVVMEQARRNVDSYRLFLPRARHPKFAFWGHGKDYVLEASRLEKNLRDKLTLRADWFFAYTRSGAEAVAALGFPESRITTLNNTIDTQSLTANYADISQAELSAFQARNDLHGRTAIFIGGLDESKRIPFLLNAADRVHAMDSRFRLVIVGQGLHEGLARAAASSKEHVIYLGALLGREKALALRASELIVMPGRVGLIAVDSLATAVPLVTTNWKWHAPEVDYLTDGVTSMFCKNSEEDYALGLYRLLNDPVKLELLREGCRVEGPKLSIENTAKAFVSGMVSSLA